MAIFEGRACGLSTAWHLVERGVIDVTVLEAADLAAGSSSSATTGSRSLSEGRRVAPDRMSLAATR
jgi:glycine/D-amino acid oxidase-like deaminating enzyme